MKELEENFLETWEKERGLVDRQRASLIVGVSHTQISNYVNEGKIKSFEYYKKTMYSFKDIMYLRTQRQEKKKTKI